MSKIFCCSTQLSRRNIYKISKGNSDFKVFKIKLSDYYHLISGLSHYLDYKELQRAERYHFEKDKNRFIICRTLLKFILAQQINVEASEIQIEHDEHKKPFVNSKTQICFNISHSGAYGLIAISNVAVGVDVEYLDKKFQFNIVLPTVFSSQEIKFVLTSINKTEAFYKLWTRKEAIVKATGKGMNDYLPKIQAMDGTHKVPDELLAGFEKIDVVSFYLDENHIAALALKSYNVNTEKIAMYTLPTTMKELIAFTHNIS